MNLIALILPLVASPAQVVTVQLRKFEVRNDISFNATSVTRTSAARGNSTVFIDPTMPTETQLMEKATKGEIKALEMPVITTVSGKQGQIEIRQKEGEGDLEQTTIRISSVRPVVSKDGSIRVELNETASVQKGEKTEKTLDASATFTTREGKIVYFLAPMTQDRKRSLLIAVRVSTSS